MGYYSNAYAVNQDLAAHGFVVLSVNYRLGIGYGRAFQQPDHAGPAGAAEYQDVAAGARFLQQVKGVDPARIGIWGGSYGGYLTGLALARNSDLFKAGVDFHGVHDWSLLLNQEAPPTKRYEQGDFAEAMKVAFQSSPDADVATWRSPVLLIQGDDDRNVRFDQTVDLSRRLDARGGQLRGTGDPQRDPRLPALRQLAGGRPGYGGVPHSGAGGAIAPLSPCGRGRDYTNPRKD